jgi:hypothetical protein
MPERKGSPPAGEDDPDGLLNSDEDDDDVDFDHDSGGTDEKDILPRALNVSSPGVHPKPHNLIVNDALRHFWDQFFPEKQYVRWTTFLNKLETHLSSPSEEATVNDLSPTKVMASTMQRLPVAPHGYGLHQNELFVLFRERSGKRNLMKSVQYTLDLESTGVLSGIPLRYQMKASVFGGLILFFVALLLICFQCTKWH